MIDLLIKNARIIEVRQGVTTELVGIEAGIGPLMFRSSHAKNWSVTSGSNRG